MERHLVTRGNPDGPTPYLEKRLGTWRITDKWIDVFLGCLRNFNEEHFWTNERTCS